MPAVRYILFELKGAWWKPTRLSILVIFHAPVHLLQPCFQISILVLNSLMTSIDSTSGISTQTGSQELTFEQVCHQYTLEF